MLVVQIHWEDYHSLVNFEKAVHQGKWNALGSISTLAGERVSGTRWYHMGKVRFRNLIPLGRGPNAPQYFVAYTPEVELLVLANMPPQSVVIKDPPREYYDYETD